MNFSEFILESNMVELRGDKLLLKTPVVTKIIKNIERIIVNNSGIDKYESFKIATITDGSTIFGVVIVRIDKDKITVILSSSGGDYEDELAQCKRGENRTQFYNYLKKTLKECPSYT